MTSQTVVTAVAATGSLGTGYLEETLYAAVDSGAVETTFHGEPSTGAETKYCPPSKLPRCSPLERASASPGVFGGVPGISVTPSTQLPMPQRISDAPFAVCARKAQAEPVKSNATRVTPRALGSSVKVLPRRVPAVGEVALRRIECALYPVCTALVLDSKVIAATGIDLRATKRWLHDWSIPDARRFHVEPSSHFTLRMPLRCPFGSLRGWLLLGPRPDGTPFGRDDLDALTAIVPSLKRALFSAREREVEREQDHAEQRTLRRTIEALGSRLAALEHANEQI